MTTDSFNKKWRKFIAPNKPGLLIDNKLVIEYLDNKFTKYVRENVRFSIREIRLISDHLVCDVEMNNNLDTVIEYKVKKFLNV